MTQKPRVLLVDDEPMLLSGLKRVLRATLDVQTCTSGQEAVALLARDAADERARFDVIVSDLRMPGMDGIELLRRARELQPHAAQILLTATPDIEDLVDTKPQFACMVKPVPTHELAVAIANAAQRAGHGTAP